MARQQNDQATETAVAEAALAEAAGRHAELRALEEAEAREAQRNQMDRSGERLEVRGPTGGRWRAGYHFTPVPMFIEPGVLTKAQRHMIDTDPLLSVRAGDPA